MRIRTCGTGTLSRTAERPDGGMHLLCHELLYITEGKVRFKWRGYACDAEAPAVFILPNSVPHELESLHAESTFHFWELSEPEDFHFTDEQVDQWNLMQSRREMYAKTALASAIPQSLDFVYHLQSTGAALRDANLDEACLLEIRKTFRLIAHVLGMASNDRASGSPSKLQSREAVDLVVNYLDWWYKEDITLEALARAVNLAPSYLVRLFKKHIQMTPFEYLRELRLKAAASYLAGSDMSISTIAQKTGFNSVHYFTRLFKIHYGQSPGEWRKQSNLPEWKEVR